MNAITYKNELIRIISTHHMGSDGRIVISTLSTEFQFILTKNHIKKCSTVIATMKEKRWSQNYVSCKCNGVKKRFDQNNTRIDANLNHLFEMNLTFLRIRSELCFQVNHLITYLPKNTLSIQVLFWRLGFVSKLCFYFSSKWNKWTMSEPQNFYVIVKRVLQGYST